LAFLKSNAPELSRSFFDIIKSELDKGNPVMVSGFGKWTVESKKRNVKGGTPKTGEDLSIKARKVCYV